MDIVLATHLFHLFNWQHRVEALNRVIRLCKPELWVMIVGFHIGNVVAKETSPGSIKSSAGSSSKYYHLEERFQRI